MSESPDCDQYGVPKRYVPRKERDQRETRLKDTSVSLKKKQISLVVIIGIILTAAFVIRMVMLWHGC